MPLLNKFETEGSTLTPLKGEKPSAPLKSGGTIPLNNTFSQGTYQNYVSDAPNSVDATGNV
jgi:hypothetical protein